VRTAGISCRLVYLSDRRLTVTANIHFCGPVIYQKLNATAATTSSWFDSAWTLVDLFSADDKLPTWLFGGFFGAKPVSLHWFVKDTYHTTRRMGGLLHTYICSLPVSHLCHCTLPTAYTHRTTPPRTTSHAPLVDLHHTYTHHAHLPAHTTPDKFVPVHSFRACHLPTHCLRMVHTRLPLRHATMPC